MVWGGVSRGYTIIVSVSVQVDPRTWSFELSPESATYIGGPINSGSGGCLVPDGAIPASPLVGYDLVFSNQSIGEGRLKVSLAI